MLVKKITTVTSGTPSKKLGVNNNGALVQGQSYSSNRVNPSGENLKIFEATGSEQVSLLITVFLGTTNSVDTFILNYTGQSANFFSAKMICQSRSNQTATYYVRYLKTGNHMRVWTNAISINIVCLTNNYIVPYTREDLPGGHIALPIS